MIAATRLLVNVIDHYYLPEPDTTWGMTITNKEARKKGENIKTCVVHEDVPLGVFKLNLIIKLKLTDAGHICKHHC